ncbi:MAG: peptidoglycan DD-metalloendopeptidase family protein [Clostridia bacterium]|nr:peptidoglycan DD-metalloendopeptidase family protein [Clostridia bacterium]
MQMGKRLAAWLSVAAAVAVMLTPCAVTAESVDDKRDELADLRDEQQELEEAISNLTDSVEDQQLKVSKLNAQVKNLEDQLTAYEETIASIDREIAEKEERIFTLNQEIVVKERLMEAILQKLKKRVAAIAKTGNYSSFQLLMSTADYEDYLLKSNVLSRISDHDQQLIAQAEREKAIITQKRREVEQEREAAIAAKEEQEQLKGEVDEQFNKLEVLYQTAYQEKVNLEKKLGTYEKQQERLRQAEEAVLKEIEEMLNTEDGKTVGNYNGTMVWPVPSVNQISCTYGQKSDYFHWGTDIWGPGIVKDPIYAAADGVVVKAKWNDSWGWYTMIDHGVNSNGVRVMTLYAHMYQPAFVSVGQTVEAGKTPLGIVGNTGNSKGAHLHFEVYEDGRRVDAIAKGYIAKP